MTPTTDESTLEEMFAPTGANPEAFALGMKDYAENNPRPNPFDYATNRDAFNSYARGWRAGKPLKNTEKTTLHLPGRTDIIPCDPPKNDADTLMRECLDREAKQREEIAATPVHPFGAFLLSEAKECCGRDLLHAMIVGAFSSCRTLDHFTSLQANASESIRIYDSRAARSTHFHGSESTAI